jgi:glyoxylase-like metal-dependent hydrolase (beta-lactamase superfamily II)
MIKVHYFTFNPFQENTYILFDETKECIIIDPGCGDGNERKALEHYINQEKLKPVKLINTHCHIDHVLGNKWVAEKYGIDLYMHEEDLKNLKATVAYASVFGMQCDESPEPKVYLNEGDIVTFGDSVLDVLFTPGHSPGSISLYAKNEGFVVAGDVLFRESIGRTDLPGGNMNTLLEAIKTKLFTLPDETIILSGHGEQTTIAHEKRHNPFLNEASSQFLD